MNADRVFVGLRKKASIKWNDRGFLLINPGNYLVSHAVARAVPSAQRGLTSVFGMGTGVTLPTESPENSSVFKSKI